MAAPTEALPISLSRSRPVFDSALPGLVVPTCTHCMPLAITRAQHAHALTTTFPATTRHVTPCLGRSSSPSRANRSTSVMHDRSRRGQPRRRILESGVSSSTCSRHPSWNRKFLHPEESEFFDYRPGFVNRLAPESRIKMINNY